MNMTGPTDLGGSDSPSQRDDRVINAIPALRTEIRTLSQRFEEHATRTERNFSRAFAKLDLTNGRVTVVEIWKAEVMAKLSIITASAKISISSFIAPVLTGVLTACLTAVIFLALQ